MIVYVVSRTVIGRNAWEFTNIDVVTDAKEARQLVFDDFQGRYTSDETLKFDDNGHTKRIYANFGSTELVVGYDIEEFEVETGGTTWLDE